MRYEAVEVDGQRIVRLPFGIHQPAVADTLLLEEGRADELRIVDAGERRVGHSGRIRALELVVTQHLLAIATQVARLREQLYEHTERMVAADPVGEPAELRVLGAG